MKLLGLIPVFDGGEIDVLWDHYETAINWYEKYLGLKVEQKEDWKPDPRVVQGKKTHIGLGLWLDTYITQKKLPYHFAERGTVDPNIRWCWRANDFERTYALYRENGIRVTDIYKGPGEHKYFDFWATMEGARFTIHDDLPESSIAFKWDPNDHQFSDSFVRVGVSDLNKAAEWYIANVGMVVDENHAKDGYTVLKTGVNYHPNGVYKWVLEKLPDDAYRGQVNGAIRIRYFIPNRNDFFEYHQFLQENGVDVGEIGGFTQRGIVHFHFYDEDGNRFNVSSC